MTAVICGTGSYAPVHTMDNNDIAKLVDTSDEWIRERTGVVRRHIIEDESTVSMAVEAAGKALEDADVRPEDVDLILVSTISSNVILPCAACEVQRELGAVNATGFDLNAACTGFVFAYNTAVSYIAAGLYRTILVIGSESLSNLTNWSDRGTCILFGDGAGAAVIKAMEGNDGGRHLLYKAITHSDGSKGAALTCASRHGAGLKGQVCLGDVEDAYMKMDGQAVFKFAVRRVPEVIHEVLEANRLTTADIDYYILHQANKRIVEAVARRLEETIEKFPMNLQEYGNTSSASIPILMDELNRAGKLKRGQRILLAGFGAGLSWGATILDWNSGRKIS